MGNKIVWIVNEYNGPNAGIRTRQTVLSQHLASKGYKVYIICGSSDYKGGKNYIENKVRYNSVNFDGAFFYVIRTSNYQHNYKRVLVSLQFQHRIWSLRNKLPKPDVIISDFAGLFGNGFLKWKKKYGTRIIFDVLDLWPELFVDMGYLKKGSIITKVLYQMEHRSYKNADSIIFSFQGGRDYIIDKGWSKETGGDVDTSSIGYLNNGVDLETVDKQKIEHVLNDPDLDTEKFTIVYLGSVSRFNGLEILVQAAQILQNSGNKKIQILIYGYGNQEERLKKMAFKYQLRNIKFKGKLDKKYAMNLLTRSDLNVFTFRDTSLLKYGTSPNKLFMYFASGRPVLSMIKPSYDLVEEHECGLSVDNNPEDVAEAMIRFSEMERDKYTAYCKNARDTAVKYDYKNLVDVLIDKIES